jgi:hypothetical protein
MIKHNDIVIDTCVLVHANNTNSKYQVSSIKLINLMLSNKLYIALEDGFDLDESLNKSRMGYEYINHLNPGDLGFSMLAHLLSTNYYIICTNQVPLNVKKIIIQNIGNIGDRHFIYVTFNTDNKILVSHDFEDFHKNNRKLFSRVLNISILTAEELLLMV